MKTMFVLALALALATVVLAQCPTPDPAELPAGPINITVSDTVIDVVRIEVGSVHAGAVAEGHSSVVAEIGYNALTQVISFKVTIPAIQISAVGVDAWGVINSGPFRPVTIPNGPFEAKGPLFASATDVHIEGTVGILVNLITNRVSCRFVTVATFTFGEVTVRDLDFTSSGQKVDWAAWNAVFKANFNADWAAGRTEIQNRIRVPVNLELQKYTLAELLNLILPKPPTPCEP